MKNCKTCDFYAYFVFLFSISAIFFSSTLRAQQWGGATDLNGNIYRIGKTAIGTSSSPLARLYLYESGVGDNHSIFLSEFGSDAGRLTKVWLNRKDSYENWYGLYVSSNLVDPIIAAKYNGNVGIGTNNPQTRLHLFKSGVGDNHSILLTEFGSDQGRWTKAWLNRKDTYENWYALYLSSNVVDPILVAKYNGSIGIGTNNPGTYKLAVEGKIGAREIVVTLAPWADFVFNDDYRLLTLTEIESFIKENKRLPDMPTSKEISENGANVGEIQAKLLQKIEELTLLMIEQNKRLQALENENIVLKNKLNN